MTMGFPDLDRIHLINIEEFRQGIPTIEQFYVGQETFDKLYGLGGMLPDQDLPEHRPRGDDALTRSFESIMPKRILTPAEVSELRRRAAELVKKEGEHSPGTHYYTPYLVRAG